MESANRRWVFLCAGLATRVHATIFLTVANYTNPGDNLLGVTLHAHSDDPNQTIIGVSDPSIAALGGPGLHQVWVPLINTPTPTRGSQTSLTPLWSDIWQPFDSYWLFGSAPGDSIATGAAFTETDNLAAGVTLPSAGFGAPPTGFGVMDTMGGSPGAEIFAAGSGIRGQDVDLAHLVLQGASGVSFSGTILTSQGNDVTFTNKSVGICLCGIEVGPHTIDHVIANSPGFVDYTWQAFADLPEFPSTTTWTDFHFEQYSPFPGSGVPGSTTLPATAPTFDYATGKFHWNTIGVPPGQYLWFATASGQGFSGTGQLYIRIVAVPETSTVLLVGLALLGPMGARWRG